MFNNSTSAEYKLKYGVPRGAVLRFLLFLIYTQPLSFIISKFSNLKLHIYADIIFDH